MSVFTEGGGLHGIWQVCPLLTRLCLLGSGTDGCIHVSRRRACHV